MTTQPKPSSTSARRPDDARAAVLARIRAALADGPAPVAIPREYDPTLAPETDIVELFVERVRDYRATVRRTSPDGLATTIAAILAERAGHRLVVPSGVPAGWFAAAEVDIVRDEPAMSHTELDALDGVVTGCAVAIAETGTIVLDAGPDQGRRALSLLPDLHVCVVRVDQIVGSVPEAIARVSPTRPLTWISGPSATSDIELQRVEGVHGPRLLDVVVVD